MTMSKMLDDIRSMADVLRDHGESKCADQLILYVDELRSVESLIRGGLIHLAKIETENAKGETK
jgi:hypothetical protein